MVYKRRPMNRRRRVNKKKSTKGFKTLVNVGRSLTPIAQRYITKMKYAESVTSAMGLGTYALVRFNLNSIFDPNQTGIGHQPYGHDTFQTMYNRYRVIGCSYRVAAISTNTAGSYTQTAVIPSNETLSPVSVSEIRENPRAKYALQAPQSPLKYISGYVAINSLVGRTKAQYMADDRYQAQFGASPQEAAILNIYTGLLTENGASDTIVYNIELNYTVEFFDVKHLAQS